MKSITTLILLILCALLMLVSAILTLFRFPRFYRERIASPFARMILLVWGIKMVIHQDTPFPETQTIYISNHTSTLDLFILVALGLPNCRFFLSGYLRKIIPLGIMGYVMGVFWTVNQKYTERRRQIFQRAASVLKLTKESVYLSPEGTRITNGEIGSFNKGAFHLATELHIPIIPLFIAIPKNINPGKENSAKPGTVHVYVKPAIDTSEWKLDELITNKEKVREMFISWNKIHKLT